MRSWSARSIVNALRTVVKAASVKQNKKVVVEIVS